MGDRIREVREELGISHRDLADRMKKFGAKAHWTTLQKLEERSSERSKFSMAIAEALGVNAQWLLDGVGPREPMRSLDRKMKLLPQDDFDDLYGDLEAMIERRLEKRNIQS
ncbi:MAG TPA: helix-turn-helix transcriptional regulator [Devosiaceae bacterium]|nr:helix-turn-helix transcriptional regulator [Devosiaceae bacterium]